MKIVSLFVPFRLLLPLMSYSVLEELYTNALLCCRLWCKKWLADVYAILLPYRDVRSQPKIKAIDIKSILSDNNAI